MLQRQAPGLKGLRAEIERLQKENKALGGVRGSQPNKLPKPEWTGEELGKPNFPKGDLGVVLELLHRWHEMSFKRPLPPTSGKVWFKFRDDVEKVLELYEMSPYAKESHGRQK